MSEYTKGKLDYSVLDGTTTPATLFINHDGDELDIAVFERWETDWAKKEMEANAKELRRRWNAFEKTEQQRDDLLAALKPLLKAYTEPLRGTTKVVGYKIRLDVKGFEAIKAAIAKCKA